MLKLRNFFRKNILWVGLVAVIVPLLAILVLQYWSLSELEKTSVVAGKVAMKNYLNDVSKEVKTFYNTNAEQALNVSAHTLTGDALYTTRYHFSSCNVEGARRLFIAAFKENGDAQLLFFSPIDQARLAEVPTGELRAAQIAIAPLRVLSREGTPLHKASVSYFDRDADNRIFYRPITDNMAHVVGVAGMVLDNDYFTGTLLPRVVRETLPKFFDKADENIVVTAHDSQHRRFYASQEAKGQNDEIVMWLPYFYDHSIEVSSRHMTPEQWAHWNFNFSLSLSLLMTGVLISGIILALRTAAREMRLSQMKTDFVSNVSHELRTPLSSIRVFGEFMKLGRVREPEKIREYGEHIETESRRLTQLINNILDFSKIESGRKTYRFERALLEDVVAETLKTCEVRLRQSDFEIVFEREAAPLAPVLIDRDAIAQALMNLLDNAVKYSEEAERKQVLVRVGREGAHTVVSVTDYGVGIAREEQKKIFEKFYRVSTGLVHDVKGSGLGLSLVKHIAEAHRGRVTVESEPGRGSTFTLHLPIDSADHKSEAGDRRRTTKLDQRLEVRG